MKTITAHVKLVSAKRGGTGPHWLVRITAPGLPRPIWRKYNSETHTEAEAVMRAARHVLPGMPEGQQARVCWRGWLGQDRPEECRAFGDSG